MIQDRYQATGPEAEFELGSRGRVLRNKRGIRRVGEMEQAESDALPEGDDAPMKSGFSRVIRKTGDDYGASA